MFQIINLKLFFLLCIVWNASMCAILNNLNYNEHKIQSETDTNLNVIFL
jgi:hypothetical protein